MAASRKNGIEAKPSLDDAIQGIEAVLERLESKNQPLEQSLDDFETGMQFIRHAQRALRDAEQRVQILLREDTGDESTVGEDQDLS